MISLDSPLERMSDDVEADYIGSYFKDLWIYSSTINIKNSNDLPSDLTDDVLVVIENGSTDCHCLTLNSLMLLVQS